MLGLAGASIVSRPASRPGTPASQTGPSPNAISGGFGPRKGSAAKLQSDTALARLLADCPPASIADMGLLPRPPPPQPDSGGAAVVALVAAPTRATSPAAPAPAVPAPAVPAPAAPAHAAPDATASAPVPSSAAALAENRRGTKSRLLTRRTIQVDRRVRLVDDFIDEASPHRCALGFQHPAQAAQTPGVVASVWGRRTEKSDAYMPFFAQKPFNVDGELGGSAAHCIGVLSHRGQKKSSPNQDDFFVLARKESLFFGVLDGHGPEGHDVAHFAQEHLPAHFVRHLRQGGGKRWDDAARAAFHDLMEQAKDELPKAAEHSGSTASVVMIDRADGATSGPMRLRCAYLGDSIVVHAKRRVRTKEWSWTQLTDIHRPDRQDESARILSCGGTIVPPTAPGCGARFETRKWSLAMSRSVGDFHAVPFGLSSAPEIASDMVLEDTDEHFVLACSDGVWDVIPPSQAVKFVGKFKPEEAQLAVERLVSKAQLRWQEHDDAVDDITAILVWCTFDGNAAE